MRKTIYAIMISLLLIFGTGLAAVHAGVISPELEATLQALGPGEDVAVIVSLADKIHPGQFQNADKGLRRANMVRALKAKADATQAPLKAFLQGKGAKRAIQLWLINGLAVTAGADTIRELADQPGVESVRLDATVNAPEPTAAPSAAPEWNLSAIRAPELWGLGITGAGTVVASMDTGVDASHSDLAGSYRGGDNSWYDPNGEYATPHDNTGHGTQVMGLMVGGDGGGTAIGVAPGAQWIAVKIFDSGGSASLSDIHQGFQWVLDPDGDPGTDDAPDVVNNSWGFPDTVGQCYLEFEPDIETLKAAGIAVVFSGGNRGTLGSESPANNPAAFAVGATDNSDSVAYFSSRGPSDCDGTIYPNVVAPGAGVKTSDLGNSYVSAIGTSVAAPHVSGAMALLVSAYPDATVAHLEQALEDTAVDLGPAGPDDDYGYGLIDVVAASDWLASPPGPVCTDGDMDGFFAQADCGTELDCNDGDPGINPDACDIKGDGIDQDCDGKDRTKGKPCPGSSDGGDTGDTSGVEGKGQTCSDGLDNDGDGSIDCGDPDCSRNKACK